MRIIFSSFDDMKNPFYGGGGAFSVHEIAKRLAKNHEVTVLTGVYPGSKDEYVDGVFYKRISFFASYPKVCQAFFQLCLPYYVMRLKYDIWFESYTPPFSTAFLPLFTSRRVVGLTQLLAGKEMSKQYKLPFTVVEHLGLKTYKEIVALNENIKDQIRESNKHARIEIIPNGENKELINLHIADKQEEYVLYLGRIDVNHKGLDLLLDIYKSIADKIGLDLVIAGSGLESEMNLLREKIKELGLEAKVKLLGRVGGHDKSEAFRKAKIFVMPSRIEALPRVLLEAYCYEVPTVLFNISFLKWVPDNVSVKVEPFNKEVFAEKLLLLNSDQQLRQELSRNAKEYVKKFDWDNIAQQYEKLIAV